MEITVHDTSAIVIAFVFLCLCRLNECNILQTRSLIFAYENMHILKALVKGEVPSELVSNRSIRKFYNTVEPFMAKQGFVPFDKANVARVKRAKGRVAKVDKVNKVAYVDIPVVFVLNYTAFTLYKMDPAGTFVYKQATNQLFTVDTPHRYLAVGSRLNVTMYLTFRDTEAMKEMGCDVESEDIGGDPKAVLCYGDVAFHNVTAESCLRGLYANDTGMVERECQVCRVIYPP